jgi:hypothetical protein
MDPHSFPDRTTNIAPLMAAVQARIEEVRRQIEGAGVMHEYPNDNSRETPGNVVADVYVEQEIRPADARSDGLMSVIVETENGHRRFLAPLVEIDLIGDNCDTLSLRGLQRDDSGALDYNGEVWSAAFPCDAWSAYWTEHRQLTTEEWVDLIMRSERTA